ncbi:MAG: recombination regulator RecX [Gammaproteobacteria bacterium]|nr:recombination regulator RecX [Gammaproteobacteria bacterium]NNL50978.1 regulatory protein RecX [Woeseiaceae bacterium]
MKPIHEEISDLLTEPSEDRFASTLEARKKAMDFLARREYGHTELVKKLIGKGFQPAAAEAAVAKLAGEGLQSDQRFAENFAQSRINQGKGPVRIRLELGQRGIGDAAVDSVLDNVAVNWTEMAREIRARKFGSSRPADFKDKARQMRFLQYRGFEAEQIQAAVGGRDE